MSITEPNTRAVAAAVGSSAGSPRRLFSLRWKLLIAFAGAFTAVFFGLAVWVLHFTTDTATSRLQLQLENAAEGGSQTIDGDALQNLVSTVPAVHDTSKPNGLGYPTASAFATLAQQLYGIYLIVPEANPYTYFRDAADGKLYFAVSAGFAVTPPIGVTYKVPVAKIVDAKTYALMERGLSETVRQNPYSDQFGSWISVYTPVLDRQGHAVAALGLDYPLTYVSKVQDRVLKQLYSVLGLSYVLLLLLVLWLSKWLAAPLRRFTDATRRIAAGEYHLDVESVARTRFPDEMYMLADSISRMAAKIAAREQSLTREVQRLRVEIDSARREQAVREITETDFFADLSAKAGEMRKRVRGGENLQ